MRPSDPKDLSLMIPTMFSVDGLQRLRDARFTLFDLMPFYGDTKTHKHLVADVLAEWGDDPDAMPDEVEVRRDTIMPRGGTRTDTVRTYALDHVQVMRLMSRFTGDVGRRARAVVSRFIHALEAKVESQAAQLQSVGPLISKIERAYATGALPSQAHYAFIAAINGAGGFYNPSPEDMMRLMSPIYAQAFRMRTCMPKMMDGVHGSGRHLLGEYIAEDLEKLGLTLPDIDMRVPEDAPPSLANNVMMR